jgi:hypothetical protein
MRILLFGIARFSSSRIAQNRRAPGIKNNKSEMVLRCDSSLAQAAADRQIESREKVEPGC